MGCKAAVACNNNKKNNCNKELDPSDEAGWVQDHENVGIADFSSFCDMHFWNDKNFAEKKSETANLPNRSEAEGTDCKKAIHAKSTFSDEYEFQAIWDQIYPDKIPYSMKASSSEWMIKKDFRKRAEQSMFF
jgi:hypothetical protein